ncbi:MAG: aminopeptidase N [Proteobacteria bacterium]|nr:aminopeptidase N [Pseudomonadota bacterium]MBU1685842.1 aminopeptidase N [Pseudomonadota bacterium]
MSEIKHPTIRLADYRPPEYLIRRTVLTLELDAAKTVVSSRLSLVRNSQGTDHSPLILDGVGLELQSVHLDGRPLGPEEYECTEQSLRILAIPQECILEIQNIIRPEDNTALEGLYRSGDKLCTQCEAQGFRHIAWYLDRPDVLSEFEVTLIGDPVLYPVMLANGNEVDRGECADGRHWRRWHDPFPKPGYLFAVVAGPLVEISDTFVTASGRSVVLRIFVEAHNRNRCGHAMASLKKAMAWDEQRFGLEYDLELYMIVAVDDFNMGAMENKGLNVFNSRYVLASPETATDTDYENIEAVIGHEYFHNWTGNRVTCRDWFQLSLKEGLTVFRDQEFSADMTSRGVKRIQDVKLLRSRQFPEDSGPMAHPVRPDEYIEINNFYTITVYEKGSELVRMIHTLLGEELFRRGLRLYLEQNDGRAATVEDFVDAMATAGGVDLTRFLFWYSQAGTPILKVSGRYDQETREYHLTLQQRTPATAGQTNKDPLHIPVLVGFLGRGGLELPLRLADDPGGKASATTRLLELKTAEKTYRFINIPEEPVVSVPRGFSAPVRLEYEQADLDLKVLLAHDPDPFCRWEAGQRLIIGQFFKGLSLFRQGQPVVFDSGMSESFGQVLVQRNGRDSALTAVLLALPDENYLGELMATVDVEAIHLVREQLRQNLAGSLKDELLAAYYENQELGPYRYDPLLAGRRLLGQCCLSFLASLADSEIEALCLTRYRKADNMTDTIHALRVLVHGRSAYAPEILADFERRWRYDPLVMDKWLTVQATSPWPETLDQVTALMTHPVFTIKNPNRVRSLIGAFSSANPMGFHRADGAGYTFLSEIVLELDRLNPQTAARMAGGLSRWRRYDGARAEMMRAQLERIVASSGISKDLYEISSKCLNISQDAP